VTSSWFFLSTLNNISLQKYEERFRRKAEIFVSLLSTFFPVRLASTFCAFYFAFEIYRRF